jgi:dTDP-4-dehydrorhamnose 3,5-epimerase
MIFTETRFPGAFVIEIGPLEDERGFFARTWCQREFAARGLKTELRQGNLSFNKQKGTLRGMHYQTKPHEEAKLVMCSRGALYDVIIDLRSDSPTFKQWLGMELSVRNRRMLYIPEGFAHGFQTLKNNTEIFYYMFEFYYPESALGVRWDDPVFAIKWPDTDRRIISPKDMAYPYYES